MRKSQRDETKDRETGRQGGGRLDGRKREEKTGRAQQCLRSSLAGLTVEKHTESV